MSQPVRLPPGRDFAAVDAYATQMIAVAPLAWRLSLNDLQETNRRALVCWMWMNVLQQPAQTLIGQAGFEGATLAEIAKASARIGEMPFLLGWRTSFRRLEPDARLKLDMRAVWFQQRPPAPARTATARGRSGKYKPKTETFAAAEQVEMRTRTAAVMKWYFAQPEAVARELLMDTHDRSKVVVRTREDLVWLMGELGVSRPFVAEALNLKMGSMQELERRAKTRIADQNRLAEQRHTRLMGWRNTLQAMLDAQKTPA